MVKAIGWSSFSCSILCKWRYFGGERWTWLRLWTEWAMSHRLNHPPPRHIASERAHTHTHKHPGRGLNTAACDLSVLSPFSGRWRSSRWWRTTCGPWCRWRRSSGSRSAWSGPPGAGSSAGPSGRIWSGRGSAPGTHTHTHVMSRLLRVGMVEVKHRECVLLAQCPSGTGKYNYTNWIGVSSFWSVLSAMYMGGKRLLNVRQLIRWYPSTKERRMHNFLWNNMKLIKSDSPSPIV